MIARLVRTLVKAVGLAGLAGTLLSATPALAQPASPRPAARPPQPAAGKVQVEVMVVHATNSHQRVDPRLGGVMKSLKFLKFQGFELLNTHTDGLSVGQEATFTVVGGRRVRVQLISRDERQATLRIRMFNSADNQRIDTTVSVHRNRSFMVAGPRHRDGVLILPVSAKY